MRTLTITTEVFAFDELSKEAKNYALQQVREDHDYLQWEWYESDIEYFIDTELAPIGFDTTNKEVFFSGFSSQGDGACFDGKLNVQMYIEHFKLQERYPSIYQAALQYYVWGKIHENNYSNRYSHERTRYIAIETKSEDELLADIFNNDENKYNFGFDFERSNFEKDVEANRLGLSQKLYDILETTYNDYNSDEAITEYILTNGKEFTSNGKNYSPN